jgi:hypothetical protein
MSEISLAEVLEQDVRDLEGIFSYEKYGLTKEEAKVLTRGIFLNLKDDLEELFF